MNHFPISTLIYATLTLTILTGSAHTLYAGNAGSVHAIDDHQKRLNDALIKAAKAGDVDEIVNLLEIGAHIDATDEHGNTPLIAATCEGALSAMLVLIKNGAKVDARNNDGDAALILAAQYGHTGAIELLVSTGSADLCVEDNNGDTAEVIAGSQGQDDAFELLVKLTAEMSLQDHERDNNRQLKKRRTDQTLSCRDEVWNFFKGPENDPDNNEPEFPKFYFM